MKISKFKATPVAMHDQPLLNSTGVHESYRIRTIVQIETTDGYTGAGETSGDISREIENNRSWIEGHDPRQMTLARLNWNGSPRAWAAVETAMLDAAAKHAGLPVCDYIGGRARDRVEWAAYLFYKFADENGKGEVATGEALDPEGFVRQAEEFVTKYGFKALKIKGGFFDPETDIETFRLLRKRFPKKDGYEIRIDPNAVWTVETSIRVAKAIEEYEPQYLEDPTDSIADHAELKKHTDIPTASNMCVSAFAHVKPNAKLDGIDVILGDHHHWGGILAYKETGVLCRVMGWGLSGHSNNALGVSQAAMLHACAATPELNFPADSHYPWTDTDEDVIKGGKLQFKDGFMDVPNAPGLGVEIDEEALSQRHEQFKTDTLSNRQDLILSIDPDAKSSGPKNDRIINFPNYKKPRW
ncbi:MAG: enolase C-terminal domain-like protein [Dehalococcoidia bacterium]|nr:enolase C-terminal domain-like protein [Dehalococcoidia bacterium]